MGNKAKGDRGQGTGDRDLEKGYLCLVVLNMFGRAGFQRGGDRTPSPFITITFITIKGAKISSSGSLHSAILKARGTTHFDR